MVAIHLERLGLSSVVAFPYRHGSLSGLRPTSRSRPCLGNRRTPCRPRTFASTARRPQQEQHRKSSFGSRLRKALNETKIEWYPIPVGVGIGFLGLVQFYRVQRRERAREAERENAADVESDSDGSKDELGRPRKRKRIRPSGPW